MLENIGSILGIIAAILGIIGYIWTTLFGINGSCKKGSFTNIDVIEYGLSDSDKQSSMRNVASLKLVGKLLGIFIVFMVFVLILFYVINRFSPDNEFTNYTENDVFVISVVCILLISAIYAHLLMIFRENSEIPINSIIAFSAFGGILICIVHICIYQKESIDMLDTYLQRAAFIELVIISIIWWGSRKPRKIRKNTSKKTTEGLKRYREVLEKILIILKQIMIMLVH